MRTLFFYTLDGVRRQRHTKYTHPHVHATYIRAQACVPAHVKQITHARTPRARERSLSMRSRMPAPQHNRARLARETNYTRAHARVRTRNPHIRAPARGAAASSHVVRRSFGSEGFSDRRRLAFLLRQIRVLLGENGQKSAKIGIFLPFQPLLAILGHFWPSGRAK